MTILTFDQYLQDLGGAAQELRNARNRLEGILAQHNSGAYSTLVDADFTDKAVTKAQYDALMVTVNDLIGTWWLAGHGTNVENYLTEQP